MDSYEIDAIKMEKAKAMHQFQTFRSIATIVRSLEIFVVILLIFWSVFRSSEYLPSAVEVSGAFLRRAFSLLFCPHFVFLLGNAIIITLFANSREKQDNSYTESISSEKSTGEIFPVEFTVEEKEPTESKIVVDIPAPEQATAIVPAVESRDPEVIIPVAAKEIREVEMKSYRRTQSAVQKVIGEEKEIKEKQKIELRRSKTVPRRKSVNGESAMAEMERRRRKSMYDVDDLSNEEFKRRVEAFIEKQQRFLREESKSVVLI